MAGIEPGLAFDRIEPFTGLGLIHPPRGGRSERVMINTDGEILPAYDLPLAEQAAVFTAAFQDYLAGSFQPNAEGLARILFHHGAQLWFSRFLRLEGSWAGFGYIGRTGDISRLAGMGFVPAARGRGMGQRLLQHLLDDARQRGDRRMTLEVFEQNAPAAALYRKAGFWEVGRLFGWQHPGVGASQAAPPSPPETLTVARLLATSHALEYPELPWQISRFALAHLPPKARAYHRDDAVLVVSDPVTPVIRILAVMTLGSGPMNWRALEDLGRSVMRSHPGAQWMVPQIFPEEFGSGFFEPLGFKRETLNQLLMHHDL